MRAPPVRRAPSHLLTESASRRRILLWAPVMMNQGEDREAPETLRDRCEDLRRVLLVKNSRSKG